MVFYLLIYLLMSRRLIMRSPEAVGVVLTVSTVFVLPYMSCCKFLAFVHLLCVHVCVCVCVHVCTWFEP